MKYLLYGWWVKEEVYIFGFTRECTLKKISLKKKNEREKEEKGPTFVTLRYSTTSEGTTGSTGGKHNGPLRPGQS